MSANQFGQHIEESTCAPNEPMMAAGSERHDVSQNVGQQLKQKTAETADQLKQKGSEAFHQVRQQAEEMATRQKDRFLERLERCGNASRRAAEQLRQDNDPMLADCAETLAGQINRGVMYFRDRDYRSMWRDTENLARRHPEVFFGGMFVAGLALARFLKASSAREHSRMGVEEYEMYEEGEWETGSSGANREESLDMPSEPSNSPGDYSGTPPPIAPEPSVTKAPGTQFTG